jgi:hypothetical protein
MELDREHSADDRFAAQTERIRRELLNSGIPFVGLSGAALPAGGRFGGLELHDDTVTNVRIVYEGARPADPWASVDTSRWAGTTVSSGPLRRLVEHHMRLCGERFRAVEWADGDTTVVVDGEPVAGRIVRAGSRWWAARCERDDIEISVVARDWHPDAIAVDTVGDPAPMLDVLAARSRPAQRPEPEPVPSGLASEPHRALVEAALHHSDRRAAWLADGGPVPELPAYWTALWQAAADRQVALTGSPEIDARRAVGSIVNQLITLRNEARWFGEDGELRQRAIAETLLYGTELSLDVASREAQEAWQHQQSAEPAAEDGEIESRAAADRYWLSAWAAWAEDRGRQ